MDTKCNAADIVIITIKLRGYGKNMTINEAIIFLYIFLSCMKAGRGAEVLLKQNYY